MPGQSDHCHSGASRIEEPGTHDLSLLGFWWNHAVIPGRCAAANPESIFPGIDMFAPRCFIVMIVIMDSGLAGFARDPE